MIIQVDPLTSCQTQWNFQNKKDYNFWVAWPMSKILRNLYLCTFDTDYSPEQLSRSPSFCIWFGMFIWHHTNMSKTSKIKELVNSDSRDQCPRYPVTFIYTLLALTKPQNNFPEVRHFVDNLGRSSDITLTWLKLPK